ncbi:hypothetical protein ACFZDG_03020 [Kitasatospora xanthocidica]|uniref:hypothetical protein n=1 Tax=Kitasatospora xanthocidica TaxID=83382 RepID=UPI0036F09137
MASDLEFRPPAWWAFLGGAVPYGDDVGESDATVTDLRTWLEARPRPKRPAGLPPVLSPEEFSEAPLTPYERERRADLLARLREINRPWR